MFSSIKQFFEEKLLPSVELTEEALASQARLAVAALMLEVAESDFHDRIEEKNKIKELVKQSFELSESDTNDLIQLAEKKKFSAPDNFEFTHLIKQAYTAKERVRLIENLWHVAYSDNDLSMYEEQIIRRIADLIYVSHKDFIASKLRVIPSQ